MPERPRTPGSSERTASSTLKLSGTIARISRQGPTLFIVPLAARRTWQASPALVPWLCVARLSAALLLAASSGDLSVSSGISRPGCRRTDLSRSMPWSNFMNDNDLHYARPARPEKSLRHFDTSIRFRSLRLSHLVGRNPTRRQFPTWQTSWFHLTSAVRRTLNDFGSIDSEARTNAGLRRAICDESCRGATSEALSWTNQSGDVDGDALSRLDGALFLRSEFGSVPNVAIARSMARQS